MKSFMRVFFTVVLSVFVGLIAIVLNVAFYGLVFYFVLQLFN